MKLTNIWIVLALFALTSCSFRYDFEECKNDADCERFATGAQILSCESNQCKVTGEAKECETDADCADEAPRTECRNDLCSLPMVVGNDTSDMTTEDTAGDMDMDPGVPCDTNAECNPGAATTDDYLSLCVQNFCQTAITEQCNELGGQLDADDTVLLGVILPMSDFNIGPPLKNSIELAVEEFNSAGGLPGGRRLTYLVCDDAGSTATAVLSAEHLIETLKVPGIVGPLFSEALIEIAQNVAIENGTVLMSPAASADNVTNLVDRDLVWRVLSSDRWQANAIADRIAEFGATRVGIIYKDDTYGDGLQQTVVQQLVGRGGLSAANVRAAPYPTGVSQADLIAAWQAQLANVQQGGFQPQVYLYIGTTEVALLVGTYFGDVNNPAVPHILSHGAAPALPTLIDGSNGALEPIVTAVAPNIFNGENFTLYENRYQGRFQGEGFLTISTLSYDATILLALAMAPIDQNAPITGTEIALNLPKLADKTVQVPLEAQGSYIGEAISALAQGDTIDLAGVSGDLDFDDKGDVRSDYLRFVGRFIDGNWELDATSVYLYGTVPGNLGYWRLRCDDLGAAGPYGDDCGAQTNPLGQACVVENSPGVGVCLEVGCAFPMNPNVCDVGMCIPIPDMVGFCLL